MESRERFDWGEAVRFEWIATLAEAHVRDPDLAEMLD
jgi:hypothetical protein